MWQRTVDWFTYNLLGFDKTSILGEATNFFLFDIVKILVMLIAIIYVIAIIRSFIPPEKIKAVLSSKSEYAGNVLAALFGIVTALSLPEMVILRKVLKKQLLAVFFGTVGVAIIFTGYLFNLVI